MPVPVPPEMRMLSSASTQRRRNSIDSGRDRAEVDHVVERQALLRELADRDERPRERERRDDHVDAAAVGEARVDHRRRLVDAAADLRDHLVDDPAQVRVVVEAHGRLVEAALALDPDLAGPVDHDLRDRVVGEQTLERPVAEDVVGDLLAEALAVVARERRLGREVAPDVDDDALAQRGRVHRDVEELRAEVADHGEVDLGLQLRERLAGACLGCRPGGGETLVEFHQFFLPKRRRRPGAPSLPLFPDGLLRDAAYRVARRELAKRCRRLRRRLRDHDRHALVDGARNLAVARDENVRLAAEHVRDVALGDADLASARG